MLLFRPASSRLHDRIQPQQLFSPLTSYPGVQGGLCDRGRVLERSAGLKEREPQSQTKEKVIATVTLMGPVVASAGTAVVSWFVVAAVTMAVMPLNFTVLAVGVALKFCP